MPRLPRLVLGMMALLLAASAACTPARKAGLTVAGSTSVQPLIDVLAEEFERRGGTRISIQGGGSTAGVQAVLAGVANLGAVSRPLTPEETSAGLVEHIIAYDLLTLIVHPDNPVSGLSRARARELFAGAIRDWAALGGWPGPVYPVSREAGSGSREAFRELVGPISPGALIQGSSGAIRAAVMQNRGAIGYVSLGVAQLGGVRMLTVEGRSPLEPGYPLVRPLSLVTRGEPGPAARAFLEFVRSPAGLELIAREGMRGPGP